MYAPLSTTRHKFIQNGDKKRNNKQGDAQWYDNNDQKLDNKERDLCAGYNGERASTYLASFLRLEKEASIKLNSTKSEDLLWPHTALVGSVLPFVWRDSTIHMQMTIAFLISAHNIRTHSHTRAAAAGWVLVVGLSHTMSSLRQTTKPKNKRIDNGRAYLCRYKRKHPASQRLQEEEIMERCCRAGPRRAYNNNHNDKSTCSWTIHLLSACLWFLCTQSSLNLHGSYFMDSLHIITQCMEARRGENSFFHSSRANFFISSFLRALCARGSSRMHTLTPAAAAKHFSNLESEREKLLSSRLTIFLLQFQLAADCVLSAVCRAGHIIDHCVRRRCISSCGSVSTCRKNATFPWHRHPTMQRVAWLVTERSVCASVVRGCFFTGHLNFYSNSWPARRVICNMLAIKGNNKSFLCMKAVLAIKAADLWVSEVFCFSIQTQECRCLQSETVNFNYHISHYFGWKWHTFDFFAVKVLSKSFGAIVMISACKKCVPGLLLHTFKCSNCGDVCT